MTSPTPTLSCPYCNAILTEIDVRSATRRVLCPHCGETFPLPDGMIGNGSPIPPAAHASESGASYDPDTGTFSRSAQTGPVDVDSLRTPAGSPARPKLSNRTIALSILAFMGLVAILFLGYALQTEQIRREHDRHLPKAQSITIPIGVAIACNVYIVALLFAIFRPKNRPGAVRLTIVLAGMTAIVVTIGLLRVH